MARTGGAALFKQGSAGGHLHVGPSRQQEGEGEERCGVRGPAWGKGEWAEPEGIGRFFIYLNKFQTSSNCLDQKVDLPSSKNST
jgi:hypothetical protein